MRRSHPHIHKLIPERGRLFEAALVHPKIRKVLNDFLVCFVSLANQLQTRFDLRARHLCRRRSGPPSDPPNERQRPFAVGQVLFNDLIGQGVVFTCEPALWTIGGENDLVQKGQAVVSMNDC